MPHRFFVRACRLSLFALLLGASARGWPQSSSPPQTNPPEKPADRVVLVIGDEKMTAGDIEKFLQALPTPYQTFYGGAGKHLLPQVIVRMKILAAEARKGNLEQNPDVQRAIHTAEESILANAAEQSIKQSISVSPEEIQKLYDARKAEFEQVHLRHIFIRANTTAGTTASPGVKPPAHPADEGQKNLEEIRTKIVAGADFAELARAHSDDQATAQKGGDMGYVEESNLAPVLASAVNSLAPGQLSQVIPTSYGYELIQVLDKRTKSLEDAKPVLEAQIKEQKFEDAMKDREQKYNVHIDTEFFAGQNQESPRPEKPPASPPPAEPGGQNPGSPPPAKPH